MLGPWRRRYAILVATLGVLGSPSCKRKPEPPPPKKAAPRTKPDVKRSTGQPTAPRKLSLAPAPADEISPACAPYDKRIADRYRPYLGAFHNIGVTFSPDGKRFLFISNRGGGTMQLYLAPTRSPDAAAKVVAFAKDRATGARFTPDGEYLLFLRDRNNDENFQIFRARSDGSEVVPLTRSPGRFHGPPQVTPDGKTLYYFTGILRTGEAELVSQPIGGGKARSIYRGKGFHALTDLSPNARRALVTLRISPAHSKLFSIDLRSGKTTQLAPSKAAKAIAKSGKFAPDGKSIYYITDQSVSRAELRRIDARTGAVLASFADPLAEVSNVQVARRGRVLAVQLDYGSHTRVKLLDAVALRPTVGLKLPLGYVFPGRFNQDGSRLLLTISRPDQPTEVFSLDAATGTMKALRADRRPGLEKLSRVRVSVKRIPTFDRWKVPVNVYLPHKINPGTRLPVLVSVHGGPSASAAIYWNPFNTFFISRGFAVVEPNVRGSTGFGKAYEKADNLRKRMDAVKDLEYVNRWVRRQPWADPSRLVVYGGSYGGYMTYMAMGHQPELWRAGVGAVGVVNLRTFLKNTMGAIRLVLREEFGELAKDGPFLDRISPITVLHRFQAPLFVYQGAQDPRVPRSEQDMLVRSLRKRHVPVEYMVALDEGHSMSHKHTQLELTGRIHRFLDQHLGRPGVPQGCRPRP